MDKTEARAIDTLLDKGVTFQIPTRGLLRYIKPNHTFKLQQAYLGTLFLLSRYYLQTGLSEERLAESPLTESREIVGRSAKNMAKIAAIGILNSKWRIRLFGGLFANFLLWRITPKTLYELSMTIVMLNNTGDFLNSIRLLSGMQMTKPKERSPADNGG